MKKKLAFELGFDWMVNPVIGVRDGVYPLQVHLVDDDEGKMISACNPDDVPVGSGLRFRVYDFSHQIADPRATPKVLQILFTSATSDRNDPISPVKIDGAPQGQWAATTFRRCEHPSIAYPAKSGWEAVWADGSAELPLSSEGRFSFRGLLTVETPGDTARFYRIDPEMIVGGAGPDTVCPATVR